MTLGEKSVLEGGNQRFQEVVLFKTQAVFF